MSQDIENKPKKEERKPRTWIGGLKKSVSTADEVISETAKIPSGTEIEQSLTAIYEGQPSKEWMNTMDRGRRKIGVVIIGIAFSLIAIGSVIALVLFWMTSSRSFDGNGIEIQIEGPKDVSIGQEVSYRINWYNVSREPLAATEFRVSFPNDFKIIGTDPTPTSEPLVFRLGAQSVEGRGTIKVSGVFTGAIGTKSVVQVVTTYRPSSFNSDFEELDSMDIQYANSVLQGTMNIPSKVVPGDKVKLTYTVTNSGSQKMEDARYRFILPEGFALSTTSTQDDPSLRELFGNLGSWDAGASTSVDIFGTFAARSGGELKMIAEAGFSLADGTFAPAQRTEAPMLVLAGDLDIEVVVNGGQNDRNIVFGEWQRIALSYQNLSGVTLEDVRLALRIEPYSASGTQLVSSLVDWSKLTDETGGTRVGNVLEFTSREIKDLALLDKDESGMIEISVPIISSATSGQDVPLLISAEAKIQKVGGEKVNRVIQTTPITLRLQTDASLSAIARYTSEEGAPVGSGPLPPVVGSSTTYRVEWHVSKTIHELDRVIVTATLPSSAIWVGEKEVGAGEVKYDDGKKLITWTINKMPEDIQDLMLSFDVTLRPTESDLGRFGQLLGESRLEYTDVKLDQSMIRTASSLTTDLPDDEIAKRKGVVAR
jgi:hypothetical protein